MRIEWHHLLSQKGFEKVDNQLFNTYIQYTQCIQLLLWFAIQGNNYLLTSTCLGSCEDQINDD